LIAIIDYDIGNLAAVANMLQRLGLPSVITADPEVIERADKIILPGNGAYDACVKNLRDSNLIPLLEERVLAQGVPLLGICVGAQMLGQGSEEGREPGLGWLDMQVKRFPDLPGLRVPHMGWNQAAPQDPPHALTQGFEPDTRFYFVHSYYLAPSRVSDVMLTSHYGIDFASGVARGNIAGVQFHPEKSHRYGKRLLANFARGA
jgi:imidazole glycerol-phosphate synthase subunit HisH